jgi:hypothetical protein
MKYLEKVMLKLRAILDQYDAVRVEGLLELSTVGFVSEKNMKLMLELNVLLMSLITKTENTVLVNEHALRAEDKSLDKKMKVLRELKIPLGVAGADLERYFDRKKKTGSQ